MFQKVLITIVIVAALIALSPTLLRGQCACYTEDPQGPYFDVATVETIVGTIAEIDRIDAKRQAKGQGIHLVVNTAEETLNVHLGPAWYLDNQEESLEKGAQIEVMGSMVGANGEKEMIAARVKVSDGELVLRDDAGLPMWRAWRKGPGPHRCGQVGGPAQNR